MSRRELLLVDGWLFVLTLIMSSSMDSDSFGWLVFYFKNRKGDD